MPIYEYECKSCHKQCSELQSLGTDRLVCSGCNRLMVKLISASKGYVKGGTGKLTGSQRDKNL